MSEKYAEALKTLEGLLGEDSKISSIQKANAKDAINVLTDAKTSIDQKWKTNELTPELPSELSTITRGSLSALYEKFRDTEFTNSDLKTYAKEVWLKERKKDNQQFSSNGAFGMNWCEKFYGLGLLEMRQVTYVGKHCLHKEYRFKEEAKPLIEEMIRCQRERS